MPYCREGITCFYRIPNFTVNKMKIFRDNPCTIKETDRGPVLKQGWPANRQGKYIELGGHLSKSFGESIISESLKVAVKIVLTLCVLKNFTYRIGDSIDIWKESNQLVIINLCSFRTRVQMTCYVLNHLLRERSSSYHIILNSFQR